MRRGAKHQHIHLGDQVRINKPWKVRKGEQKVVVRQRGPNSYLLDDGWTWNASQLSALPSPDVDLDVDREVRNSHPGIHAHAEKDEQCKHFMARQLSWAEESPHQKKKLLLLLFCTLLIN